MKKIIKNDKVYSISELNYSDLKTHPSINETEIKESTSYSSHDLNLIGTSDVKTEKIIDNKGVNLIITPDPSDANNPSIINDNLPQATNRTWSGNKISTTINNLKEQLTGNLKIDNTHTELPANPEINTMYLIPISGTNNYTKYIVDSFGNVINAGTTEIDLSDTLKTTDLDNTTTQINTDNKLQANSIISVNSLPTTNILENSIYKDNSDDGKLKYYNNNDWQDLGSGGGGYKKIDTLWTGNASSDNFNVVLSADFRKYNELDFVFLSGSYKSVINIKTNQFNMDIGKPILVVTWSTDGAQRWMFVNSISADGKTINVTIRNNNEFYLKKVVGYKIVETSSTQQIEDILWNGNLSPAQGTSITLNKNWTEFDYLIFKTFKSVQYMYNKVRVSDLLQTDSSHMIILEDGWDSNLRYLRVWYNSNTKINLDMVDENLIQVIGVKTKATASLQLKTKKYSGYIANVSGTVSSWSGSFTIDDGYQIVSVNLATEGFVGVAYIATNGIRQDGNRVYLNGWWSCQWAGSNSGKIGYTAIAMKLE